MKTIRMTLAVFVLVACLAGAQDAKTMYASMAPVEQYLIADRNAEIALARSAAPEAVGREAEVRVLGGRGYETSSKGTNGFVCLVVRAWATGFDDPEFWNPKVRTPHCFNAAAARSVLPAYLKRTELVLEGLTKEQVLVRMKVEVAKKVFTAPETASMCYMLSKGGHLNDKDGHWHPHLMFFLPTHRGGELGREPQWLLADLRRQGRPRVGDNVLCSGGEVVGWDG